MIYLDTPAMGSILYSTESYLSDFLNTNILSKRPPVLYFQYGGPSSTLLPHHSCFLGLFIF